MDTYRKGDAVRIRTGAFASFNGRVEEVFDETARLNVIVNVFARETTVQLHFDEVRKIDFRDEPPVGLSNN
ncbi:MAG TPA: KOW motif-containing protein [Pyrinomonadaceae bacterium]|jgi:transcriptional antiterminator NusG|nr:KOW motif-containing protein [Pyrinomonadaceae bacterium]